MRMCNEWWAGLDGVGLLSASTSNNMKILENFSKHFLWRKFFGFEENFVVEREAKSMLTSYLEKIIKIHLKFQWKSFKNSFGYHKNLFVYHSLLSCRLFHKSDLRTSTVIQPIIQPTTPLNHIKQPRLESSIECARAGGPPTDRHRAREQLR